MLAAALSDAMALAIDDGARPTRVEFELTGSAPVGAFVEIEVRTEEDGLASATASVAGSVIARASGVYLS